MVNVYTARVGKLITDSLFSGYDHCLNPYVGCQMGCTYCYVRFFIKDKNEDGTIRNEWGDFVRTRNHIKTKLAKELLKVPSTRLVIGTMTDPYQPIERKQRLTREALTIILASKIKPDKVGIFTRSPIVEDDIDLIKQLPRARVHFTITPYSPEMVKKLEPVPVLTKRRFQSIAKLKAAGIRVHVNIAPAIPIISDAMTNGFADELAKIGVDEFFVDPLQAYGESWKAVNEALSDHPRQAEIEGIVKDKVKYQLWKNIYRKQWEAAWNAVAHNSTTTLPIWSDHEHHTWVDMRSGQSMSKRVYGDDLPPPTPQPVTPPVI